MSLCSPGYTGIHYVAQDGSQPNSAYLELRIPGRSHLAGFCSVCLACAHVCVTHACLLPAEGKESIRTSGTGVST